MWSNDELHLGMRVEVRDDDILIRLPRATHNQCELVATSHSCYLRKFLGLRLDLQHAVETCVATHRNVIYTNAVQLLTRLIVLNVEVGEAAKHLAEHSAPWLEERLIGPED